MALFAALSILANYYLPLNGALGVNAMHWRKALFSLSVVYLITLLISVLLTCFVIPNFEDVGHLKQGCYLTNAMLPYIECREFIGYSIAKFVFNLPLQLLYLPVFGVISFLKAPWLIFFAVFAWSPIFYFIWYLIKQPKIITKRLGV